MNYETLNNNLDEICELLKKSSPNDILNRIANKKGRFAVLTADEPAYPDSGTMTREQMQSKLQQLQAEGKIGGFFHVQGRYQYNPNAREHSFLVHEPKDFSHIQELGRAAGQESVFLSDSGKHQVAFVNGQHQGKAFQGEGHTVYQKDPLTDPSIPADQKPAAYSGLPSKGHKTYTFMNTNYDLPNAPKEPIMKSDGATFNPNIDYENLVSVMKSSPLSRLRTALLTRRNAYGTTTTR